jgi:hypothetical protein
MDQQFTWILAEHPDKAAWQEAAAAYLASLKVVATGGQIGYLNMMFRSLFAGTDTPNTPLEFCHFAKRKSFTDALRNIFLATDASGAYLRTPQSIQQIVSTTERFFRLLLDTHAFHPETGAPDPSYTNPVTALRAETPNTYHKGETEKEALPDEVKAEMIEALTSPVCDPLTGRVVWTFSWAKTLTNDQLDWVNPDTKQTERIWSPARALAVLFMLHSPLRGLQVRFLGSGEGDPEVYVPHAQHPRSGKWGDMWAPTTHDVHGGDWVPNKSRWAPGPEEKPVKKQRFTGVLRRFQSSDGTHYLGTYISTNKTADKNVNPAKFGYEIPLILPVNLEIVEYLTAWQAQHNPANTPKSRTELHTVPDKGSKKMTGLYPPMHYLFRDAAADHPDEPISKPRLSTFWISLSHHVDESRKRQGKPPYGLVVTHNKADGAPASVMYSLHALRVTAVTEMAENGVPFSVIAAMCGHARWVMSAYYVKLRNEFIRDSIFNAKGRDERVRVEAGDRHWKERFQPADPLADLSLLVGASDVVIPRLQATQRALVKIMDHGFCVFGGARCHDGGPVIKEEKGRVKRGPVPGGASNCASCAWWGSGVPWIPGLLSYLNALGLDQSLAIERYEAADAEYTALVVEQQACARREEPFDFERLEKPQRAREQAAAIRIDIGNRMAPLSIMVERCNALPDKGSTGKPQLLISEEVHEILLGVIEAATLTDQALQTLKDAEVYAFDATPATLVVGRVLSHTLSQSGIPFPVLSLSSSELAAVVRQMDQLVKLRLHGKGLNAVFNDALVVDSLGLTDEFRAILSASVHRIPEQDLVPLVTRSQAQRLLGSAVPLPESVDVA